MPPPSNLPSDLPSGQIDTATSGGSASASAPAGALGLEQLLPHVPLDFVAGTLGSAVTPAQHEMVLNSPRMRQRVSHRLSEDLELPLTWPDSPALRVLTCGSGTQVDRAVTLAGALRLSGDIRRIVDARARAALIDLLGAAAYELVLDQDDRGGRCDGIALTRERIYEAGSAVLTAFLASLPDPVSRAIQLRFGSDFDRPTPAPEDGAVFELAAERCDA